MNAAANGHTELSELRAQVADLQAQRTQLFAEVQRLREQRNEAVATAIALQQQIDRLRERITELGGDA